MNWVVFRVVFLVAFLFFVSLEFAPDAWEWVTGLDKTPEQRLVEEINKQQQQKDDYLAETRKKAEEGSASDLFTMGYAYEFGEGLPQSHSIAVDGAREASGSCGRISHAASTRRAGSDR